ncbi:Hypothetical predicted protein [Mytilus galloprovincialis]|uniref:Reverse transcriptase/retrotransposon-derived protein RNase H-like domain-containing protein n=1 Tax=Mytilus galloprovincialis TaxID=29158 RepID=A0A8B6BQR3_MYTGA|nr:Hypothetical predicted protein [Mytilus galloprovincialis]
MLREHFEFAQKSLSSRKAITLPKCSDQLWIVTDGSVTKRGIGATLYINRDGKVSLAGFFSAKLRKHQVLWLPCEIEALSIAASVKHFSPFIIQSKLQANVLTDSKPCVQGFEKLCRGEFSASPRVTSFSFRCKPIPDEKLGSLRDWLIHLLIPLKPLKPLNGPSVVVRVDLAPGFRPLCDDSYLKQLNISIEIGRVKNQNKNPVADKAIAELEDELLREERDHSPLSENTLVIATTRLNSRLRQRGFVLLANYGLKEVTRDGEWCFIKKFSGNQLRPSSYKVKLSECYKVLNTISVHGNPRYSQNLDNQESDSDDHDEDSLPGPIRDLPPDRAEPPPYSYLRKYRRC